MENHAKNVFFKNDYFSGPDEVPRYIEDVLETDDLPSFELLLFSLPLLDNEV